MDGRESNGAPCGLVCVVAPFSIETSATGAVELLIPSTANETEQRQALELAAAVAEVVGDFHRRERLDQYRQSDRAWRAALQFVERIHRADLHETSVAIANEGRWFTGCDRASLLCCNHRGYKLLAVSGVDQLEPRAAIARRISELAAVITKTNEAIWAVGAREGGAVFALIAFAAALRSWGDLDGGAATVVHAACLLAASGGIVAFALVAHGAATGAAREPYRPTR
jgi:hypothetical protein